MEDESVAYNIFVFALTVAGSDGERRRLIEMAYALKIL